MRPVFNLEPRYRITMLTRKDWTKGQGAPPEVKGQVWFTDGSKMKGGPGPESMGSLSGEGSAFHSENTQRLSRPKYMLSGPAHMKFNILTDQRDT
jgi:hypothetical protein